jgi:hypothetical protein
MNKELKQELKFKDGSVFSVGTMVKIEFPEDHSGMAIRVTADGVTKLVRSSQLSKFGIKQPTINTMTRWVEDGIARSVGGKKVEPDGWDSDGTPSWLLVVGII